MQITYEVERGFIMYTETNSLREYLHDALYGSPHRDGSDKIISNIEFLFDFSISTIELLFEKGILNKDDIFRLLPGRVDRIKEITND